MRAGSRQPLRGTNANGSCVGLGPPCEGRLQNTSEVRAPALRCSRFKKYVRGLRCVIRLWGPAMSPRGDMPKHRVRSHRGGRTHAVTRRLSQLAETQPGLVGRPDCPAIVDVQIDEDFAADPRFIPGSVRGPSPRRGVGSSASRQICASSICQKVSKLSAGVAAWLRHAGGEARCRKAAILAWADGRLADGPRRRIAAARWAADRLGHARRPKVDRIACPG